MLILPSMYQSTILGTSVRPRAPPKALPFQTRPVTSWNGRVEISLPASATPMMMDSPYPGWQHSSALAHDIDVSGGAERIVRSPVRQILNGLHDLVISHFVGIDEVGHPFPAGHFDLGRVQIDPNDLIGAHHSRALNDVEADSAEAEDDDI